MCNQYIIEDNSIDEENLRRRQNIRIVINESWISLFGRIKINIKITFGPIQIAKAQSYNIGRPVLLRCIPICSKPVIDSLKNNYVLHYTKKKGLLFCILSIDSVLPKINVYFL